MESWVDGDGWICTYLETWPSLRRILFISDRSSGSCVEGVYVPAALGTRTGVVGSEFIVCVERRSSYGWVKF